MIHKQPGRKPLRRRARTPRKEKEINDRKFGNLINKFHHEVVRIWGLPEPKSKLGARLWKLEQKGKGLGEHLALKELLEKKGMGEQWCLKLRAVGVTMAQEALLESAGHQRTKLLSRKDEALVLKEMRAFLAAVKEAKETGIR